ncbi:glycoside hydrolase family 17 protein [Annulohypoxylon truncatum]|uniref:glycoside hydrolase family 17 protein n=1 Tax=Annulohypoxylon truncatum TaxID=327061 RepID=UPI0020089186|nr:glycoside hydrolase family 17 protein [Annulohypoxylon truncatum]KAI1208849.1 glycoside hydrolase family 17 protein [Annulohypoxylon truncatum]
MKATFAAAAVAALAGSAAAGSVHHRHAHAHDQARAFAKRDNSTCGCTTIYSTYYGEATLSFPPVPATTSAPPAPVTPTSTAVVVPTPVPQTCSTTGVYTFPATTVTLTESTTVCVPSTTSVPVGTHTLGGVTTVVSTATTVTCPYATVSTSGSVTTSVVETTTYVCPSAGTYTIAPHTVTASQPTTVTVPSVTSYTPGTYTQPQVVTTVTETSTVVYCPFDIPTPSASTTPVAVPTSAAVPAISVSVSIPAPAVSSIAVSSVVPSATVVPSSSSAKPSPSGALGGAAGKPWGISYTPYETSEAGGCKSQSEVEKDIAAIAAAGITSVRVYSTDCDTLTNVGGACAKHGLKMILGIFIDSPGCDASNPSVTEQISAIKSWAQWDLVELISVGNEAVFHGYCQPSELASLITKCKGEFSGYTGKYTTAETVNIWQQSDFSSAICGVVDVAGANAHAFFNTQTDASQAGQFVKGQLDIIDNICKNVPGIILETGWPSQGEAMGLAVPGVSQQAEAIKSIVSECGDKAVLFSLTSDQWKDGNTACKCERYFGCASVLGISL